MSTENELEILPDQPTDIGGRLISDNNLQHFRGLEGQVVFGYEQGYRPYVMDGSTFGGKPLAFLEDRVINDGVFTTGDYQTELTDSSIHLDVNNYCQFQVDLRCPTTTLTIDDYTDTDTELARQIRIFLKFTTGSNMVYFPSNFFFDDMSTDSQLNVAQILSQNKAGDLAAFEAYTFDSGALWFGRLIGYWSK